MKETLKDLKERRSCRDFKPEQIDDELLEQVLEAGTWAPTGMGLQSPLIVAVQDYETVSLLKRLNAEILGKDLDPFYGAQTILVVLADADRFTYLEDGSLVMGNLMNAAHAVGLGSCWIHRAREVFASDAGQELLKKWGIEGNYVGIGHCALGYANTVAEPKPRKKDYVRYIR